MRGWIGGTYDCQFFICCLDVYSHPLDIVIDPIEHGSLINDHRLQLLKNVR